MALLSMGAVGRRLGRSSRSVRRLVALGRLKAKRDQASGLLYVEDAEVERYERDELRLPAETKDRRRPKKAVAPPPATPAPVVPERPPEATTRPEPAPSVQPPAKEPDKPTPPAQPTAPAKPATPTPPAKPTPKKGTGWTLFD